MREVDVKLLPKDVYLVLASWKEVCRKYDITFVENLKEAVRCLKCIEVYVEGWKEWDVRRKVEWLQNYFEWLVVNGKKLSSGWKELLRYLDVGMVDDGVRKVLDVYRNYVRSRFGKDVGLDVRKKEVIRAARTLMKVASELGLSVEEVVKYQHECWEKIDRPLSFEGMADESKVRRRVEVYLDVKRRAGDVLGRKECSEGREAVNLSEDEKKVVDVWRSVVSLGVMFFVGKQGFIGEMAREVWEKLCKVDLRTRREILDKEYSPENVLRRWIEMGKPALFV